MIVREAWLSTRKHSTEQMHGFTAEIAISSKTSAQQKGY